MALRITRSLRIQAEATLFEQDRNPSTPGYGLLVGMYRAGTFAVPRNYCPGSGARAAMLLRSRVRQVRQEADCHRDYTGQQGLTAGAPGRAQLVVQILQLAARHRLPYQWDCWQPFVGNWLRRPHLYELTLPRHHPFQFLILLRGCALTGYPAIQSSLGAGGKVSDFRVRHHWHLIPTRGLHLWLQFLQFEYQLLYPLLVQPRTPLLSSRALIRLPIPSIHLSLHTSVPSLAHLQGAAGPGNCSGEL